MIMFYNEVTVLFNIQFNYFYDLFMKFLFEFRFIRSADSCRHMYVFIEDEVVVINLIKIYYMLGIDKNIGT